MGPTVKLYKETDGSFTFIAEQLDGSAIAFMISGDDAMKLAWTLFQCVGEVEPPEGSIEIEEEDK